MATCHRGYWPNRCFSLPCPAEKRVSSLLASRYSDGLLEGRDGQTRRSAARPQRLKKAEVAVSDRKAEVKVRTKSGGGSFEGVKDWQEAITEFLSAWNEKPRLVNSWTLQLSRSSAAASSRLQDRSRPQVPRRTESPPAARVLPRAGYRLFSRRQPIPCHH